MYILYFNAVLVLLVGLFASKHAYEKEAAKWFVLTSVGGFLWVLAYALIDSVRAEHAALAAGRFAFVGPILGAPSIYYMIRTIALERRPRPYEYLALYAVSLLLHLPAVASDAVLAGVSIDLFGNKTWEYGPLAFLPGAFWFSVIIALAVGLIRERGSISWPRVNRVLWITSSFLAWLMVGMVTNVFVLMILEDSQFYYVGPASIIVPFSIIALSVTRKLLPDLLGMLGKLRPNSRSRFLGRLKQFEQEIETFGSMDAALNRLSEIVGGRVSMAFEGVASETGGAPKLWGEPVAWEKFYSPSDRNRWNRISEVVAKMDDSSGLLSLHKNLVTGWSKSSQFEEPRDTLWPLGSMASLRVSSLVAQRIAEEPLVVLTDQTDTSFVRRGIERIAGRKWIYEDTYPDAVDGGRNAGESLRDRIAEPKESLLIVIVETHACASDYEARIKELVDRGLKVVGLVRLEEGDVQECAAFGSNWLSQLDIPVIELFPSGECSDDISAMIDVILLELDGIYGTRVRLSPEEREYVLSGASERKAFPLIPTLEKIVLSKKTGRAIA